jgi:hypothetical protein
MGGTSYICGEQVRSGELIAYSFQKDKQEIQVQNQDHHVGENWTLQPTLGCYGKFHETMST